MKKVILVLTFCSLQVFAAKAPIEVEKLSVEETESIKYDGSEGLLVKFKGIKKRVYLPKEDNENPKIFSMIEKAKEKNRPLKLKMSRVENDLVMYRSGSLNEVLTVGGDCKKILTKSTSPRLHCSKGYAIKRAELGLSVKK